MQVKNEVPAWHKWRNRKIHIKIYTHKAAYMTSRFTAQNGRCFSLLSQSKAHTLLPKCFKHYTFFLLYKGNHFIVYSKTLNT